MARPWRNRLGPQLALLLLVLAVGIGYAVNAARSHDSPAAAPSATTTTSAITGTAPSNRPTTGFVPLSSLPGQAAQTVRLIKAGGPFPYSQDGVVFNNNEHLLPQHPRGYYHEYTVKTPGSSDRGARRIITGQGGEYYYTDDHYESFRRIDIDE